MGSSNAHSSWDSQTYGETLASFKSFGHHSLVETGKHDMSQSGLDGRTYLDPIGVDGFSSFFFLISWATQIPQNHGTFSGGIVYRCKQKPP